MKFSIPVTIAAALLAATAACSKPDESANAAVEADANLSALPEETLPTDNVVAPVDGNETANASDLNVSDAAVDNSSNAN